MADVKEYKNYYDIKYAQANYFSYREWLYAPYISSLVSYAGLKPGSRVLDVGCGQGLFSHLFHKRGLRVHGIDISEIGIRQAQATYGKPGLTFEVVDLNTTEFAEKFDCVFVRSCSLYNSGDFASRNKVTEMMLKYLKPDGVFIFAFNSTFSSKTSQTCHYHSLSDMADHFREYPNGKIFFTTRIDAWLLRKYAFQPLATRVNTLLSKVLGLGGDLVCILKQPSRPRHDSTFV